MAYIIKSNTKFMAFATCYSGYKLTADFMKATPFKSLAEAKQKVESFIVGKNADASNYARYVLEGEQKLAKVTKVLAGHNKKLAELMTKPMSEVESKVRKQRSCVQGAEFAIDNIASNLEFHKKELRNAKAAVENLTIMEVTVKAVA